MLREYGCHADASIEPPVVKMPPDVRPKGPLVKVPTAFSSYPVFQDASVTVTPLVKMALATVSGLLTTEMEAPMAAAEVLDP
jgi:hypothetical protein